MKIANMTEKIFWNDMWNFNKIFRKDVSFDNIKSNKKPTFHSLYKINL